MSISLAMSRRKLVSESIHTFLGSFFLSGFKARASFREIGELSYDNSTNPLVSILRLGEEHPRCGTGEEKSEPQ